MKLKIGTVLCTRDGRKIGNGIILDVDKPFYVIKTDFGNIIRLTKREIKELFRVAGYYHIDPFVQIVEQKELLRKNFGF